jgi:hypothetical protein
VHLDEADIELLGDGRDPRRLKRPGSDHHLVGGIRAVAQLDQEAGTASVGKATLRRAVWLETQRPPMQSRCHNHHTVPPAAAGRLRSNHRFHD